MSQHIIHIFGASGSGTSTLSRAIAEKTGYTFLDSDDYIWAPTDPPFTNLRTHAERLPLLERDLDRVENAVLSGSLVGWGDPLIYRFTLAVRLVVPHDVRMSRLERRELDRYGDRILPGGICTRSTGTFSNGPPATRTAPPPCAAVPCTTSGSRSSPARSSLWTAPAPWRSW